jgi:tRNA pseudouridine55 synthase
MQVPPQFSAVKVDGERAYKKARDGEAMDLAARPLWVEELLLADRPDADHVVLEMTCGKGGYVRSIARDLGEVLGCYGHVVTLRRIWSGPFQATDGVSLDQIDAMAKTPQLDAHILPLEIGLADLPEVRCLAESVAKLRNGNPASVIASDVDYGEEVWASFDGQAIAVGTYRGGELHPTRVFVTQDG